MSYRVTWHCFCNTYHTAMDGNRGIMEGVSILTTAICRTLNLRAVSCIVRFTNHNLRIIYPCHVVLDSTWYCDITSRGTEYHTIIMSVSTNGTTENSDSSLTCVCCLKSSDSCISCFAGISISTYRAVCTATIYIMENSTAINSNISVTLDETDSDVITATKTAAIDVAVFGATLVFCSYSIAINYNVRTTIYSCQ